MERLTIDGGEVWLGFARNRVKAFRRAGIRYTRQVFEMPDGAKVIIEVAGKDHTIRISNDERGRVWLKVTLVIQNNEREIDRVRTTIVTKLFKIQDGRLEHYYTGEGTETREYIPPPMQPFKHTRGGDGRSPETARGHGFSGSYPSGPSSQVLKRENSERPPFHEFAVFGGSALFVGTNPQYTVSSHGGGEGEYLLYSSWPFPEWFWSVIRPSDYEDPNPGLTVDASADVVLFRGISEGKPKTLDLIPARRCAGTRNGAYMENYHDGWNLHIPGVYSSFSQGSGGILRRDDGTWNVIYDKKGGVLGEPRDFAYVSFRGLKSDISAPEPTPIVDSLEWAALRFTSLSQRHNGVDFTLSQKYYPPLRRIADYIEVKKDGTSQLAPYELENKKGIVLSLSEHVEIDNGQLIFKNNKGESTYTITPAEHPELKDDVRLSGLLGSTYLTTGAVEYSDGLGTNIRVLQCELRADMKDLMTPKKRWGK